VVGELTALVLEHEGAQEFFWALARLRISGGFFFWRDEKLVNECWKL